MTPGTSARRSPLVTGIGALAVLSALTFLLAASMHLGVRIPLGFAVLTEPRILPAAIVETLCGLALGVGGYGMLTGATWAWPVAIGAHAFALAGVLLGIVALAAGGGPSTSTNDAYHLTMIAVLVTALILLTTPITRDAFASED